MADEDELRCPVFLKNLDGSGKARAISKIRRGHVLKVDLTGNARTELTGPHYCVVVSNNRINRSACTLLIVPLTTHGGTGTVKVHEVAVAAGDGGLLKAGAAKPIQVRSIDPHARVTEVLGVMSPDTLEQIVDLVGWAVCDTET